MALLGLIPRRKELVRKPTEGGSKICNNPLPPASRHVNLSVERPHVVRINHRALKMRRAPPSDG